MAFNTIETRLWMWGFATTGQLGDNTRVNKSSAVQTIAGGTDWKQVSAAGNSGYAAAIKTDGTLWCWGLNSSGQLGNNTTTNRSSPVQTVAGGTDWKQLSARGTQMAAIKTDGTLWSWGAGTSGQRGDNTATHKSSPVQTVAGGTNWKYVACGTAHIAAIKTDGTLWSWGSNTLGELGDNTSVGKSSPVQTIAGGTNWKQLACGYSHTLAIKTDGTLWTWGQDGYGQLGDNNRVHKSSPVQTVAGGTNWKYVSAGARFSCAIKTDGTLWNWGRNNFGHLGDNTTSDKSSPVQTVAGGTNWKYVAGGPNHNTALKTDGTLWVCGYNARGELGDNTLVNKSSPVQTITGGTNWIIATDYNEDINSYQTSLGLTLSLGKVDTNYVLKTTLFDVYPSLSDQVASPALWLWGRNSFGQLGDNTIVEKSSPVQTVAGGANWKHVSSGGNHTAAIKTDGTLWTWGNNPFGQLGDNTGGVLRRSSPVQTVAGGTNWKQVSAGGFHTAAIKTDGTLWAWGQNTSGELGDNTVAIKSSPVQTITGGTNWKQVSAGLYHTAAIKTDGTLWAWGLGTSGQLGDNTSVGKSSPVQTITGGTNWKQVAAGNGTHTSAIKTDGTLWTWGQNTRGELGDNTVAQKSSPVQTVAGGTNWKYVAGGGSYTAAIKTDGTLWTWGLNNYGQLGNNTTTNRSSPVQTVAGGTNWKYVSGGNHTAAIKTDGTLWTWGYDTYGQLGDNTRVNKSSPVQTIAGGTNWKYVSAGSTCTAAIAEDNPFL